jgi:ribonuclease HI
MNEVTIYTDGSCWPNPGGPGGFGCVLLCGEHRKEIKGGVKASTNNRMEMMAVIAALSALSERSKVTLYSDSQYVVNGSGWALNWYMNGWRTREGKPIKNKDLWEVILVLMDKHDVTMIWVRGHNGHPLNELCDRLAGEGAKASTLYHDRGFAV